eukprot:Gb_34659 [translate_table: standard]
MPILNTQGFLRPNTGNKQSIANLENKMISDSVNDLLYTFHTNQNSYMGNTEQDSSEKSES